MKNNTLTYLAAIAMLLTAMSTHAQKSTRWITKPNGSIEWKVGTDTRLPHKDDIEMSGRQLSVVLRYGVDEHHTFSLERSLVWPMLRVVPNQTRSHLNKRFATDVRHLMLVNNMPLGPERVDKIVLDGIMRVESHFTDCGLQMTRLLYPSTTLPVYIEQYTIRNRGDRPVIINIPNGDIQYQTEATQGVYGAYVFGMTMTSQGTYTLINGDELTFHLIFYGRKATDIPTQVDPAKELEKRRTFVDEVWSKLVIDTPNDTLNRMFAFAKVRASESIYETRNGLMHGSGGESYYAAIWPNDQAEYVNPFFPFLGYDTANRSAINAYRMFARYMNDDYDPLPASIHAEGLRTWARVRDRGDGAMCAYGAARYALARADRQEAEELWPFIVWCLEYCRRQVNVDGVVCSDSDELEDRFTAGEANLCTSSLYYDALLSAVYLGRELGKSTDILDTYARQATEMQANIERYFGCNVRGYDTYCYHKGNEKLRSWICIPLCMGIYNRAEATAAALFSSRLWTDDGLLTEEGSKVYWDRSTLYALRGIFAAGATEKGLEYLQKYSTRRLLGDRVPYAIEAWPEGSQRHLSAESALYCRIFTEGIFGIRPTGFASFDLTPNMPKQWDHMVLRAVQAFGRSFDISIHRLGQKLSVTVTTGKRNVIRQEIVSGQTISVKFK